jgi:hypothetical protein
MSELSELSPADQKRFHELLAQGLAHYEVGFFRRHARFGPEYCLAVDECTPCACGATPERGICRARKNGPAPQPLVEVVMVPR